MSLFAFVRSLSLSTICLGQFPNEINKSNIFQTKRKKKKKIRMRRWIDGKSVGGLKRKMKMQAKKEPIRHGQWIIAVFFISSPLALGELSVNIIFGFVQFNVIWMCVGEKRIRMKIKKDVNNWDFVIAHWVAHWDQPKSQIPPITHRVRPKAFEHNYTLFNSLFKNQWP